MSLEDIEPVEAQLDSQSEKAEIPTSQVESPLPDDWFWRPVHRHQTTFVTNQSAVSAWRHVGRIMELANGLSSQTGTELSGPAFMYSQTAARKK